MSELTLPTRTDLWSMRKWQVKLILPQTDNNGHDLSHELDQVFNEIMDITGGYTLLPDADGVWLDNISGQIFPDDVMVLYTTFDYDRTDILDAIRAHVRPWCDTLRQESLYCFLTEGYDISQASSEAREAHPEAVTL